MGGTRLTVDGGEGRLAVFLVQDRIVFSGETGDLELDPVFGLSLTLEETVSALTGNGKPEGVSVWRRDADTGGGLPLRLHIGSDAGHLELTRIQIRPLNDQAMSGLGTGQPPVDVPVRPLSDLWESDREVLLR
jgi:hypothetical protein